METREGPEYQAVIPALLGLRAEGCESDDPRSGCPGPSALDLLNSAAGREKASAESLPLDARADTPASIRGSCAGP